MKHCSRLSQSTPLIIGALFLITSPAAQASVDYFDLAPEQLLQTKVLSVSRKSESVAEAPAAIFVITNEDIARSGVTTIPDALRLAPGVHVAQLDSNSWAVGIRGFNSGLSNKLLVLLDGRTIYNPVFGGVLWEAHDLVLEDIEQIEVIRGPGGTLWGANAVNGVISITTKHSRDTQGNLVSALYGNEERGTLSAHHGGTFNDGSYRLYAKGFKRDTLRSTEGRDAFDEWYGYRSGFRADWDDHFTLQGNLYRTNTEQRRMNFSLVDPAILTDQNVIYEGASLLARWTAEQDDGSKLSIQSYIDWTQRDEEVNFVDNRTIYDLELQYNLRPLNRHEIILGGGYRFSADQKKESANVSFSPQSRNDSLYNIFMQDKIALLPEELFLTLGSKFEYNDYSGLEIQPNARLHWLADERQTLWASVSRAVRTPTAIETDMTSTIATDPGAAPLPIRMAFVPNKDFKPEELTAYEIGYRNQITPDFSLDTTAFYNVYDNLQTITLLTPYVVNNGVDPLHIFFPVPFRNDMRGRSFGFEAAASWELNPDLKISANYSYLRLEVNAADSAQESAEDSYPSHQIGLRTSWNISDHWTLDGSAYYVGRIKSEDIDDYLRMDLNLGWKMNDQVRFNLVGQNLISGTHREFGPAADLNAAKPQSSIFGKITWEF